MSRAGDLDLALPRADGLDDHHIEAGRVEQIDRIASRAGDAAQPAAARHAPNEDTRITAERLHADAVAKDRAAGERRGGVYRDDANRLASAAPVERQRVHQRGFAGTRRSCHADDMRAAGARVDRAQQLARDGSARLRNADPACQGATIAGKDRVSQIHDIYHIKNVRRKT